MMHIHSEEDCFKYCEQDTGCFAITFKRSKIAVMPGAIGVADVCRLFKMQQDSAYDDEFSSIDDQVHLLYNFKQLRGVVSKEDCSNRCEQDSACFAVTLDKASRGGCRLYSKLEYKGKKTRFPAARYSPSI